MTIGPKIQGHLRELEFTGGIIRRSVHYDEGIEHLNLDVLAFSQQFEDLENNVRRLNDCIENIDSSIYEMVTDFLVGNGLTVITGVGRNPVDREILIDNLIPYLYSYYYKREEFTVQVWPNDPFWRVKGAAIANSDSISDMKDYIEMLRDHDNIRLTIQDINDEIKNLIVLGQKLSVNIGMNVIRLVENGEYTTTCKYCEKYISN